MSQSPLAFSDSLRIGVVNHVSPDSIQLIIDIEAPEAISLNTGTPRPFPKINGYLLVPSDKGFMVGQIEWITVESSQYPKRKGMQDFGLLDLPFPLRKLNLNPVGTLTHTNTSENGYIYIFRRGIETFPSVGDPVFIPTVKQLQSIIDSGENRRVIIGTSPLADGAEIKIDPDRLFGRHLAVLGNTGSGKSCSVAGLIRWSVEAAKISNEKYPGKANARFVILDPNGEYSRALKDIRNTKIFTVESSQEGFESLKIPLWFWNSTEWSAFTQAGAGAQRPLLRRALREIRSGGSLITDTSYDLRRKVSSILISLRNHLNTGDAYEGWKFGGKLQVYKTDLEAYAHQYSINRLDLERLANLIDSLLSKPGQTYQKKGTTEIGYNDFPISSFDELISELELFLRKIGGIVYQLGPNEDAPIPFDGNSFAEHLMELARGASQPQYFDYLILRVRTLLSETRMKAIISDSQQITLDSWLNDHLGNSGSADGTITIIDLSLVPSELIYILTSVISRIIFEALQRYRRNDPKHKLLPTVLVMEEAHNFIKRYREDTENQDAATTCCKLFEKIAREGRKFGLGLVLSSQRPSELSATVLSQCNTFLLHRISNDKDQEMVNKLVPDNLSGLLRDLPSLPSQNAILLGWASELPTLVKMRDLPKAQQPQSDDPDFWDVWTGNSQRPVDWHSIAQEWQHVETPPQEAPPPPPSVDHKKEDNALDGM